MIIMIKYNHSYHPGLISNIKAKKNKKNKKNKKTKKQTIFFVQNLFFSILLTFPNFKKIKSLSPWNGCILVTPRVIILPIIITTPLIRLIAYLFHKLVAGSSKFSFFCFVFFFFCCFFFSFLPNFVNMPSSIFICHQINIKIFI